MNFRRKNGKRTKTDFENIFQNLQIQKVGQKNSVDRLDFFALRIVSFFVVLGLSTFVARAYYLQITKNDFYTGKSDNNQFIATPILPMRGSILDRNGEALAASSKVDIEDISYERKYTDRVGFGHLLGYVNYPQKDDSGNFWKNNFEGVSGLEAYYDQILAGKTGKQFFERGADGKMKQSFLVSPPIEGKDIKTSIDAELQEYSYKELKSFVLDKGFEGGTAILMDIDSGQILTMTSYPQFDSKYMVQSQATSTENRSKYLKSLNDDLRKPYLNRAIAGTYAPGSTMKSFFALAALQLGLIDPMTSIFSSGKIEIPNVIDPTKSTIFRDWKAHGWVNVRTALANSSDVFFYAVGGGFEKQKGLGITAIDDWAKAFGADSLTGIDLPGEVKGNIPSPEWKDKIFNEAWWLGDTYHSAIGQYGFLLTPIALLRMNTAIATNGKLITPRIRDDGTSPEIVDMPKKVDDEWYKVVQDGERMVVTSGTAKSLNSKLVEIAGKSGTAEVGVDRKKIQSWIVGYYPASKPKYAFIVLCEMGTKNQSPTPNVLARKIIEKMYFMPEYHDILAPFKDDFDLNTEESSTTAQNAFQ